MRGWEKRLAAEFWTKREMGWTERFKLRRDKKFFIQNNFVTCRLKLNVKKISFFKEEKSWIELLRCKCGEYNSELIEEIDCLKPLVTALRMTD